MTPCPTRCAVRFGAIIFAGALTVQAQAQSPDVAIKKKFVEITVEVDAAFKPYGGLFNNCLAEGKAWAAKMDGTASAEYRTNPGSFRDNLGWTYDRSYAMRSAVGRYISVVRTEDTFEGAAHPNESTDTILWDNTAQKRISVRPFFVETADNGPTMTALAQAASLAVAAAKLAQGINGYGDDDTPAEKMTPQQELKGDSFIHDGIKPKLLEIGPVTLAPSSEAAKSSGLTFHYSPYAVGPYVEGPYTVLVPWTDFKQYLSADGQAIFAGTRPKADGDKW